MLDSILAEIEQAIDVPPPPTISVHPDQPLSDACAALVRTHARRLPLVDKDDQTGKETIVSVLTQYRVLKFIAINVGLPLIRILLYFKAGADAFVGTPTVRTRLC